MFCLVYQVFVFCIVLFFFPSSGQAVVTGVVPSAPPPPFDTCLHFQSVGGFSVPTARRLSSVFDNSRPRAHAHPWHGVSCGFFVLSARLVCVPVAGIAGKKRLKTFHVSENKAEPPYPLMFIYPVPGTWCYFGRKCK